MSTVKVNKITPRTCNSIQLGESGDTLTIPSGATLQNCGTATGFGLSFCTTVKTSPFTATAGKGFFINTGSAVTVTLPASPSVGNEVIVVDSTGQVACNAITLGRNGSKIKGGCQDLLMTTNRGGLRIVYSGSSQGWVTATAGNDATMQPAFITATGGTESTSGDFKIHTFTSDGTFTVSKLAVASANNKVSYIVVAGGGSGAPSQGCVGTSCGGAGGFREGRNSPVDTYTASPLAAADSGLTVTASAFPVTVGAGGTAGAITYPNSKGVNGSNSIFSTITSAGGGFGTGGGAPGPSGTQVPGGPGGSGGGGGTCGNSGSSADPGGTGNTPPVSPAQGTNGGSGAAAAANNGGGGGGATASGTNGTSPGGCGGAGATTNITGSPVAYAGGGGGGNSPSYASTGGTGGGAAGKTRSSGAAANAGTVNTGGGGAGSSGTPSNTAGGLGGSGVVIIRYKFQ